MWRSCYLLQLLSACILVGQPPKRRSFIWNGLLHGLPAFQSCTSPFIHNGRGTLVWLDKWVDNRAPAQLWPDIFRRAEKPLGSIFDLVHLTHERWFTEENASLGSSVAQLISRQGHRQDSRSWVLTTNGSFSVKSFYNFLMHGGIRCSVTNVIWKGCCPKKISLFSWLVWDYSVPTLDKLAKRGCNRLPTATCVLCNGEIESVDHLFISCPFSSNLWAFASLHLKLPPPPPNN